MLNNEMMRRVAKEFRYFRSPCRSIHRTSKNLIKVYDLFVLFVSVECIGKSFLNQSPFLSYCLEETVYFQFWLFEYFE